ncbi:MAG: BTAD domain-containing putative transcriptional regulator [Deltaproteobacteria bacterium]
MRSAPSIAKITRPSPTGCFPRKRLFRELDRELKRPILWISGPPGSGKTTLVSSYVAARKLPCVWYQVDPRDGDVATCFYYLGLAARKAAPRIRKALPLLTPEYLPDLPAFTRRFFESLFSRLKSRGVIVFDDCHGVAVDSPFHAVVQEGLSFLPVGNRAILISRGPPPVVFSRFLANREMGEFDSEDLRFTRVETRGMVDQSGYASLSRETLRNLHEKTGGWAAGIVILMREHSRGRVSIRPRALGTPQAIFDYFAGETFRMVDPEIRDFLMRSAFLPRMTAEMAEKMTGQEKGGRFLSYLHRHNCFTEVLPDGGTVYRYHQLFREFLLARAKEELAGEEGNRLRRTAGAILAESGDWEDAVEPMRESGDWGGLVPIVISRAPSLIAQGRFKTLEELLRAFPQSILEEVPWLSYWLGVAIVPFEPANARRLFEKALARFRRERDATGAFLSWAGICPAVWFAKAGYEALDSSIASLDDLLREFGGFPSPEIEAQALCSMIQALGLRLPATIDCDEWVARALAVADKISEIPLKAKLLGSILNYWMCRGVESTKVYSMFASIEPLLGSNGVPPIVRIEALLYCAINLLFMGEYDRCLEVVAKGLKHSESSGLHVLDMFLLGQGTLAAMHKGDMHAANNSFRRMASLLPKAMPHDAGFYHYIASWEALERGDTARAEHHWKINTDLVRKVGFAFIIHVNRIEGALVMRALGRHEEARALLADARRIESMHRCDRFTFLTKIMESVFLTEDGDASGGVAKLREGLAIAREFSYLGTHFWHPGFQAQIAARALREGIEVPFVREMIRKNRLLPGPDDLGLEEWPWPVKVYTLGRFELVVDGKTLPFARKTRQKPLLLLKALIALGGREVPEEQLSEILWPDADGDLAHQSMATTLKRLRKQLGDDRSLLLRDGRLTLNNRHCWVDAWALERILGRAGAAPKPGAPVPDGNEITRLAEKAVDMYKGTFLSGETLCSSIVTYQERLRSKFLRAVVRAGRHWEQAGEWDRAISCYQKGQDVDPLSEEMYRGMISCNMRMGRAAEAHAVYQRCCKTLSAVLGVNPSPDLKAILICSPAASDPVRN